MAPLIPWPVAVRLPLAALLMTWGALTNRAWIVPVAAGLALPQLGYGSYAVVVIGILGRALGRACGQDTVRGRGGGIDPAAASPYAVVVILGRQSMRSTRIVR